MIYICIYAAEHLLWNYFANVLVNEELLLSTLIKKQYEWFIWHICKYMWTECALNRGIDSHTLQHYQKKKKEKY